MWTYHFYSSVHWLPFMGIFVNSNTSFAKSLGMLKSTALQKSLIPFSSLSLSLPGPLGTSYILSAYQCHSGGKVGYLHSCSEAGSTLSFLTGNCLYFKKKKNSQQGESRSLSCAVFLPFTIWEFLSTFHSDPPADVNDHCSLTQSSTLASHLWKVSSHSGTFWLNLSRVPKWNVIGMVFSLFKGNDGHLETASRRNQVVRRLWQIWKE